MKTKIIPFDLETAKKIQAGKIEGSIKTRDGQNVQIVLWDKKDEDGYVILSLIDKPGTDLVISHTRNGEISKGYYKEKLDLVLEVPDNEPQFNPFDKVLVRHYDISLWQPAFFWKFFDELSKTPYYTIDGNKWEQCISYAGNENLVGTTDKPKEE